MGIFLANGTRVTQATVSTTPDDDPLVVLDTDLYRQHRTGREDDKPQGEIKTLWHRAGSVFRESVVKAWFRSAEVTQVLPDTGAAAGGEEITLYGNFLDGVTGVAFGGTAGTGVTVVSDRECKVTTPAKAAGTYDLTITDDKGTTTVVDGFTFA